MIIAQIIDNVIINTITLDDITLIPLFQEGFDTTLQLDFIYPQPGIGWWFDNINWNAPIESDNNG